MFRYSDENFIALGALVERVSGLPLEVYAQRNIVAPLGLADSGYLHHQGSQQRRPRDTSMRKENISNHGTICVA